MAAHDGALFMAMILEAVGLDVGYGNTSIANGIGLSVSAGEVVCLLGPNGCGKTTLFKTLLGLLPPLRGRLELDGSTYASYSRAAFARRVGYVPQAQAPTFAFRVIDIVMMGRASQINLFRTPSTDDLAAANAALETLGISHLAHRLFSEISGGERQMALIARALAQGPQLLVMDEPTSALDFGNEVRVLETIQSLSSSGLAIVLSTHNPSHALACADRVALMKAGSIIAIGAPDETVTPRSLHDLYGVDVSVTYMEQERRHICIPSLKVKEKSK